MDKFAAGINWLARWYK